MEGGKKLQRKIRKHIREKRRKREIRTKNAKSDKEPCIEENIIQGKEKLQAIEK